MGSGRTPPTLPPETFGSVSTHSTRPKLVRSVESDREAMLRALAPNPDLELTFALEIGQATRPISTGQLHASPRFHLPPISSWSTRGLQGPCGPGYLVLRPASRLDAFSGYPFRTQLPGYANGMTTGTLEVRPFRSSRTMNSSSQVSCAHGR